MNETPDVADYIIAARLWKTIPGPGGLRSMTSIAVDQTWQADRPLVAECKRSMGYVLAFGSVTREPEPDHHAPQMDCQCGIWALNSPLSLHALAQPMKGTAPVFGVVKMWGRVVHASDGWRGQYARPDAVVAWGARIRKAESEVSTTYGIPILTDWPDLTAPYSLPEIPESGVERRPFQPQPHDAGDMTWTSAGTWQSGGIFRRKKGSNP